MLSSLTELIALASQKGVALPAFDVAGGQTDFLLGALRSCEAARCPAVLLLWMPPGGWYMDLEGVADLVRSYARRSSVPVVLHLDHGRSEEPVTDALRAGFRSVMFDGSALPLDENIRRTRDLAQMAHAQGATIEGELGRIGRETGGEAVGGLTDVEEAVRFVRETGVDLLAPSVGNAHGFYREPPRLRFDLIGELARRTGVPLSLHGGTGIPFEDLRSGAQLGIRKVNVASQIHKDFADAFRAAAVQGEGPPWRQGLLAGRRAVEGAVMAYLEGMGVRGLCT